MSTQTHRELVFGNLKVTIEVLRGMNERIFHENAEADQQANDGSIALIQHGDIEYRVKGGDGRWRPLPFIPHNLLELGETQVPVGIYQISYLQRGEDGSEEWVKLSDGADIGEMMERAESAEQQLDEMQNQQLAFRDQIALNQMRMEG